uniref:Uncharacterized protein n=1 Tax=Chromera velia CCMP2878 TaxID=1169474 RepID=A0A0G4F208_9ALVE|eukprot:Cvel_2637.t1-p1 / transcript=Cvel_2637.t1 / gene=Cvel_2637 / organism=Chromera_velia_CCMP2878 / gene_product=hypothetical protein / transcript_product=hypothetical protein / location=Cvel_scaffold104:90291-91136(+) / protein_length=282 / sequence_SO=supercontig / SO=protein_coding / is_pseudo=false
MSAEEIGRQLLEANNGAIASLSQDVSSVAGNLATGIEKTSAAAEKARSDAAALSKQRKEQQEKEKKEEEEKKKKQTSGPSSDRQPPGESSGMRGEVRIPGLIQARNPVGGDMSSFLGGSAAPLSCYFEKDDHRVGGDMGSGFVGQSRDMECGELSKMIQKTRNDIAEQMQDLCNPLHLLPAGGKISQLEANQKRLRKLLDEYNSSACPGEIGDASKYATDTAAAEKAEREISMDPFRADTLKSVAAALRIPEAVVASVVFSPIGVELGLLSALAAKIVTVTC